MQTLVAVVLGAIGVAMIIAGARGAAPSVLGTLTASKPKATPKAAASKVKAPIGGPVRFRSSSTLPSTPSGRLSLA